MQKYSDEISQSIDSLKGVGEKTKTLLSEIGIISLFDLLSYPPIDLIDKTEIEKFSKLAKDWWNPEGKFRPLHLFNPVRIKFIKEKLIYHFKLNSNKEKPLEKLRILDIGSGGGLLCEPLYRLGANVTGVDASDKNIEVAKLHAKHPEKCRNNDRLCRPSLQTLDEQCLTQK